MLIDRLVDVANMVDVWFAALDMLMFERLSVEEFLIVFEVLTSLALCGEKIISRMAAISMNDTRKTSIANAFLFFLVASCMRCVADSGFALSGMDAQIRLGNSV